MKLKDFKSLEPKKIESVVALFTDYNQDNSKISARVKSIKDPDSFTNFVNKYKHLSKNKNKDKLVQQKAELKIET